VVPAAPARPDAASAPCPSPPVPAAPMPAPSRWPALPVRRPALPSATIMARSLPVAHVRTGKPAELQPLAQPHHVESSRSAATHAGCAHSSRHTRRMARDSGPDAPYTRLMRAADLLVIARALDPDGDWRLLQRAVRSLAARAVPSRNKEPRLRPSDMLVELGFTLMRKATTLPGHRPARAATLHRDGADHGTLAD
jgi:hypothetical protein